jgi:hypothetical protein
MMGEGLPTLHFNDLNVMVHHLHHINMGEYVRLSKTNWPPIDDPQNNLTQSYAVNQLDQVLHLAMESASKYDQQTTFGQTCPQPPDKDTIISPWVWIGHCKIPLHLQWWHP